MHVQDPPFCVQVEFTEGCNLLCDFCGLNGIRSKPAENMKFMSLTMANHVAASIAKAGWTSRIEFAMHGEPTMNPQFIALVAAFRKHLPRNQLMMTSNGGGLLKDTSNAIDALFAAGLNILALDDYQTVNIVPKIRQRQRTYPVHEYPVDGLEFSPHRRWSKSTKVIIIIEDIGKATSGSHASLTNHCGCGAPPNDRKQGQRCAKPFRELGIRWDGAVAGCCNDWRGIVKVGSVITTSVADLWRGAVLQAMRRKLYAGQRDFGACSGCDYVSYRNGLLPDKLGKVRMDKPKPSDAAVLLQACAGKTFAPIVWRPWERK